MSRGLGLRPGSLLSRLGPSPTIAVLRPGRLGDMIVTLPALRALRSAAPGARLCLLTSQALVPFCERLRFIDEIIIVPPPPPGDEGYGDDRMKPFLAEMRKRRFDLALQCVGGGETTNVFVNGMGARFTAGARWPFAPELNFWIPFQLLQPEVLRLMDIMGLVGVPTSDMRFEIDVLPRDLAELQRLQGLDYDALIGKRYIGAHVGSKSGARRWPPERFAAVLDTLLDEEDIGVVLLAGDDEKELDKAVMSQMRHQDRVLDLAGRLSLGGLIGLISQLRLLIGNDSGPAHLATALNTPAVIIFGSAHPSKWAPLFRMWQRPVADLTAPCRSISPPCGCPDDARAHCLNAVTVDAVLWEARSLLRLIAGTIPPN